MKMKYIVIIPAFCFFLQISGSQAQSSDRDDMSGGCDKAIHFFWKGRQMGDNEQARKHYQKAIDLCPGFIRPYELLGNLYRKEKKTEKAIAYFNKAAELGTTNYKLYYLLASLVFEKGDLDEANRNIKKSLSLRGDYPKALELVRKMAAALASGQGFLARHLLGEVHLAFREARTNLDRARQGLAVR